MSRVIRAAVRVPLQLIPVLLLLQAGGARAQDPAAVPQASGRAGAAVAVDGGLQPLWETRRDALLRGDVLAADEAEASLRERRRANGISRAEDLAGAFVLEGYENLALNHLSEAREAFQLAVELDPDMPRAHFGLAQTEWSSDRGALAALASAWEGVQAATRNWLYRTIGLSTAGWSLLTGLPLAFAILYTLLFLKTLRVLHHTLTESFSRRLPPATATVLAAMGPFLPLALPWGAAWTPLLWLILATPHLSRSERRVAGAGLLVLAAAGVLAVPAARVTSLAADPRLVHVAGAARGAVGADRQRTLADLLAKAPDDAVLHVLYAGQARGLGDYATALRSYRRAAQIDPRLRQAHNNAGTLFFNLGQFATAVGEFRKAIEVDPGDMTAHYNLYLTQEQRFDFAAAERTLSEAQGIDLQRMTSLLSEREKRQGRLDVLEDTIPVAVALRRAREAAGIPGGIGASRDELVRTWPAVVLPLLALVLIAFRRPSTLQAVQCLSCGRIACRLCALNLDRETNCASCIAVEARSTALPRRIREQKQREMAAHRASWRRISHILTAVLPGAGQIWAGRVLSGTLLLALAASAASWAVLRGSLPVISYAPLSSQVAPGLVGAGVVLLMTWLLGWFLPRGHVAASFRGRD